MRDEPYDSQSPTWLPINAAPKDGTSIQAKIPGNGSDNVIAWFDGLLNDDGKDCGAWQFTSDQEPPDCWTDGVCWGSNEDGVPSVQPTHWKPLPKEEPDGSSLSSDIEETLASRALEQP
jgi:hypothetical protein